MTKLPWKPWHQVVELRPDVRSNELSLSQLAADLYDVIMDKGTPVYRDPAEFFAPTFPTHNLRDLAKVSPIVWRARTTRPSASWN
jgi:hypothetical protein